MKMRTTEISYNKNNQDYYHNRLSITSKRQTVLPLEIIYG